VAANSIDNNQWSLKSENYMKIGNWKLKIVCALAVIVIPVVTLAMTSTNYMIEFDSVNVGGVYSTSSSFTLEDTTGEVSTGYGTSTNYRLHAGYQQLHEAFISISLEADVALGNISGIVADSKTGSSTWTVITDSPAGYELTVTASSSPALTSGPSGFNDYSPATSDPDFTFAINATEAAFGFTVEGNDIVSRFKDNGSSCNAGGSDTLDRCWEGFATSSQVVASGSSSNQPSGTETTLKYRAENGSNHFQDPGNYQAVITVTAIAL
jgi:hypothetical protein